uniref:Uncharacterized protein n=1 Tax=Romanomermis culicivorax TaxID=13658 RepID=A0A915JLZ6_ROMCU
MFAVRIGRIKRKDASRITRKSSSIYLEWLFKQRVSEETQQKFLSMDLIEKSKPRMHPVFSELYWLGIYPDSKIDLNGRINKMFVCETSSSSTI